MVEFTQIKGAAYWASYLINGDASGLDERERALADTWLERNDIVNVVDCADEAHFTWNYDLHTGDVMARGGDVLDYTVELKS
jgi:uncharacterized protein YggL (DUF469 family)